MNKRTWILLGLGGLLLIGVWRGGQLALQEFLLISHDAIHPSEIYPPAPPLPPVVKQTTEELLAELDRALQERVPAIADSLQPGLSDEEIAALEAEGNFQLPDDLRALYKWHNGMSGNTAIDFIPGHRFIPLDEVVQSRALLRRQVESASGRQRAANEAFVAHRLNWLMIFADAAGDGYFYDPERSLQEGAFFYHFTETGYYRFFPSIQNFLAGVIKCFKTGVYHPADGPKWLEEDYERSEQIWRRLGAANSQ